MSDDYDVLVRVLCKCQNPSLVLCHYKGYPSNKDEWVTMKRLSFAAINTVPDVHCSSVSPSCPHRMKVGKCSGLSVSSDSVDVHDQGSSGTNSADYPRAMVFLGTMISPLPKHPKPPVPLFLPSPPSPPNPPPFALSPELSPAR